MSGTVLGTRYSTVNKVHERTGYIICKAQCKKKMQNPLFKLQEGNSITLNQAQGTYKCGNLCDCTGW